MGLRVSARVAESYLRKIDLKMFRAVNFIIIRKVNVDC